MRSTNRLLLLLLLLLPADPILPGKMAVEMEREHLVVWSAMGVSDHTLYVLIDHL